MKTVNHKKLMELGFSMTGSKQIIREAKAIAIQRFNEDRNSSDNMLHRRLDLAPTEIVEELLGFQLT